MYILVHNKKHYLVHFCSSFLISLKAFSVFLLEYRDNYLETSGKLGLTADDTITNFTEANPINN